jgi:hypothetical protein
MFQIAKRFGIHQRYRLPNCQTQTLVPCLKNKASPKFQIGDRVAEKPKPRAIYAKTAATIERIKPYTVQRYGTVLDTVYQGARGKASVPYVKIIWDGAQTPVTHAQSRICLEKI